MEPLQAKSQRYKLYVFCVCPHEPLQSACQHSWFVSRSLFAAWSIFKMLGNRVWLSPPPFICLMVKKKKKKSKRRAFDSSVPFSRVFIYFFEYKFHYIVCFIKYNYFLLHSEPHVIENYLCVCMSAYHSYIWILFTLICLPHSLAELKTNGGSFNIYEAHLTVCLAWCS